MTTRRPPGRGSHPLGGQRGPIKGRDALQRKRRRPTEALRLAEGRNQSAADAAYADA
jgi:hypothetical protein